MYIDRKKAWLGAAIGLAGGIVGGIINKRKQKRALRQQQAEANRNAAIENANAMEEAYNNQEYVDAYNDRLAFAYGGKRKKCNNGAEVNVTNDNELVKDKDSNNGMISDVAGGIANGLGSVTDALLTNTGVVTKPVTSAFTTKSNTKSIVNGNIDIYSDRLKSANNFRCGGKRMKHR